MSHYIPFKKMQGAGNDYIYIDCTEQIPQNPGILAQKMSDRHFGIGSDGLVLILPSTSADFKMRMFNSDGSEAEMCGNASRCVGKFVYEGSLTSKTSITLETKAGIKTLNLHLQEGKVGTVTVDMGEPRLTPQDIPIQVQEERIINYPLKLSKRNYRITCVSMGNPHTVLFVDDLDREDIAVTGPEIESHSLFPAKCNVEFAQIISPDEIRMRVWERGAGETLACGTGACATLVAGVLNGLCHPKATIRLLGGDLTIEWDEKSRHVFMTGGAETVFEGTWPL